MNYIDKLIRSDYNIFSSFPQVKDFDKFSRHRILGEVRVHLCDMEISYPLEVLKDLQAPQKVGDTLSGSMCKKLYPACLCTVLTSVIHYFNFQDLVGEVLLFMKYLPTLQRLEVGLLKIRAPPQPSKENQGKCHFSCVINSLLS